MPDAFTSYGGSQYINSRATGRYADYLARDLVAHVDRRFRTLASARHRAVAGKSSGGYGALVHGMLFPDVFGAVASHSGDTCFEYCYLPDFPKACTIIGKAGGLDGWWRQFRKAPRKTHEHFLVLNILAMTAAYSPTPTVGARPSLRPRDRRDARRRLAEVARRTTPSRMLETGYKALRGMRLVFLDGGTKDEWNLHIGARIFVARARELGVKVTHEEFLGRAHGDPVSLRRLAAARGAGNLVSRAQPYAHPERVLEEPEELRVLIHPVGHRRPSAVARRRLDAQAGSARVPAWAAWSAAASLNEWSGATRTSWSAVTRYIAG